RIFDRLDMQGGAVAGHHPPTYHRFATLSYQQPSAVRGDEWSVYSGPAGAVNLGVGVHLDGGGAAPSTPLATQIELLIEGDAVFDMNVAGHACTAPLRVGENLRHRGTLVLSGLAGGDLYVVRNWWDGTLVGNGRRLYLIGTTRQELRGSKTLADVTVDNPAGVELSPDTFFAPSDLIVT